MDKIVTKLLKKVAASTSCEVNVTKQLLKVVLMLASLADTDELKKIDASCYHVGSTIRRMLENAEDEYDSKSNRE